MYSPGVDQRRCDPRHSPYVDSEVVFTCDVCFALGFSARGWRLGGSGGVDAAPVPHEVTAGAGCFLRLSHPKTSVAGWCSRRCRFTPGRTPPVGGRHECGQCGLRELPRLPETRDCDQPERVHSPGGGAAAGALMGDAQLPILAYGVYQHLAGRQPGTPGPCCPPRSPLTSRPPTGRSASTAWCPRSAPGPGRRRTRFRGPCTHDSCRGGATRAGSPSPGRAPVAAFLLSRTRAVDPARRRHGAPSGPRGGRHLRMVSARDPFSDALPGARPKASSRESHGSGRGRRWHPMVYVAVSAEPSGSDPRPQ
jgi:hypothetical protein